MKIALVVDDEPKILNVVRDYLSRAGFEVVSAANGQEALTAVANRNPDIIILDLGLPDMDGLDITRELRRHSQVPLIMLTARDEETDRILGLELGADDYVTKPFSPKELVARVRALLRRMESQKTNILEDVLRVGALSIDLARRTVHVADRKAELTSSEFDLLSIFARQPGRVFTRAQLLDAVHGVSFESYERAIDSHIKNIRRKIEPDPSKPIYLLMVYGIGYKLAEPDVKLSDTP
jgi:DNA-binding response OmpR family regulator